MGFALLNPSYALPPGGGDEQFGSAVSGTGLGAEPGFALSGPGCGLAGAGCTGVGRPAFVFAPTGETMHGTAHAAASVRAGDVLLTMGAGDVDGIARGLADRLR